MNSIKEETPRSNSTMSPIEKVSLWLPATQPRAPVINEKQKASLLAQLNGIDEEPQPIDNSAPEPQERKSLNNKYLTDTVQEDFSCFSDESKIKQKHSLMNELFGQSVGVQGIKDTIDSPRPLKTSLKTSAGSRKSVKFHEEELGRYETGKAEYFNGDLF